MLRDLSQFIMVLAPVLLILHFNLGYACVTCSLMVFHSHKCYTTIVADIITMYYVLETCHHKCCCVFYWDLRDSGIGAL